MSHPGIKGFCKICASKWLPDINRLLKEGSNAAEIMRWVQEASSAKFTFTRQTLYKHRDNDGGNHKLAALETPRVPSDPRPPAREPGEPAERTTNDEFLEFIRDHGMEALKANPAQITPKMAMEAVKILESRNDRKTNVLVLARVLTNQIQAPAPEPTTPEIVEGEYRLIETSEGVAQQ